MLCGKIFDFGGRGFSFTESLEATFSSNSKEFSDPAVNLETSLLMAWISARSPSSCSSFLELCLLFTTSGVVSLLSSTKSSSNVFLGELPTLGLARLLSSSSTSTSEERGISSLPWSRDQSQSLTLPSVDPDASTEPCSGFHAAHVRDPSCALEMVRTGCSMFLISCNESTPDSFPVTNPNSCVWLKDITLTGESETSASFTQLNLARVSKILTFLSSPTDPIKL
ncbi:hypothetical protein OGAPHI_000419 [Ogataea philodendri]|uniref:Uncharacterized protein n=1 Tax=Ogataea philodendri TaxID=1378263 RepID=A0A9P8PI81_9ASCO|nr:uncharacterized protein OGAPHI_000419 [Ogataea philodendri]KAH3671714.1 hypothetical protein OGAPHI_000419 [Ogataea philodendri]